METGSSGLLSIVGVPIGNLGDLTFRALETLKASDVVFAEDTRVTRKLLSHYEVSVPVESLHAHSTDKAFDRVVECLSEGKRVVYVTDAGTPSVSDPGGFLVKKVRQELPEIAIESIPGPSSLTAALSVAGVTSTEFTFYGFFPRKKGRQTLLKEIAHTPDRVAVFFESTHRIVQTITLLAEDETLMWRRIVVCKELTKLHERVISGTPSDVLEEFENDPQLVRGEFVVVIDTQS